MIKRRKTHTPEEDIQFLEAHLAGTLKPVAPPRDIVQRLRERIRMPDREEITLRLTDWRRLFIVFGGVVSGAEPPETIAIEEPHPRKPTFMTSEKFTKLRNQLYSLLHDEIRKSVIQSTASERAAAGKGAAS